MKILSVVNQKGGVGKTTTAVNLAIGIANTGKKVLAIDLDPQGSMSISLGISEPDALDITIGSIFDQLLQGHEVAERTGIQSHKEGIDFIPSNILLSSVEINLIHAINRENILKRYLKRYEGVYDYIIIDCSPSLGMLTINALACSHELVIPIQAQYLSIKGMEQLMNTIRKIKAEINETLEIKGILITMADLRTNFTRDIISVVHDTYAPSIHVFHTVIPFSVRASESSITGSSIFTYDTKGKVAEAYLELVKEVLS